MCYTILFYGWSCLAIQNFNMFIKLNHIDLMEKLMMFYGLFLSVLKKLKCMIL